MNNAANEESQARRIVLDESKLLGIRTLDTAVGATKIGNGNGPVPK